MRGLSSSEEESTPASIGIRSVHAVNGPTLSRLLGIYCYLRRKSHTRSTAIASQKLYATTQSMFSPPHPFECPISMLGAPNSCSSDGGLARPHRTEAGSPRHRRCHPPFACRICNPPRRSHGASWRLAGSSTPQVSLHPRFGTPQSRGGCRPPPSPTSRGWTCTRLLQARSPSRQGALPQSQDLVNE